MSELMEQRKSGETNSKKNPREGKSRLSKTVLTSVNS
jgi:hypothetical protein